MEGGSHVYVAGFTALADTPAKTDYLLIQYDLANGNNVVRTYNGPGNATDIAYAVVVDPASNVYIIGESMGDGTRFDYATLKYTTTMNQCWVARYDGPVHEEDSAYSMAVDEVGHIYVTGASKGSGSDYDYATLKYCLLLGDIDQNGIVDDADTAALVFAFGSTCTCCP